MGRPARPRDGLRMAGWCAELGLAVELTADQRALIERAAFELRRRGEYPVGNQGSVGELLRVRAGARAASAEMARLALILEQV